MAEYIDRKSAIDVVARWFKGINLNGDICIDGLRSLPAADVVEWKPLPEDVEELVKRLQIAADWAGKGFCITPSLCLEAANAIEELTDRNVGKWLFWQDDPDANVYECSACHEPLTLNEGTPRENNFNFCPFCGLPMKEGDDDV